MDISLCILVLNELVGCKHDIPLLPRANFKEVYAIDGGSTDGTIEYLESQQIRVIHQEKPGYNNAYISAFSHCGTDALVLFHPKGSVNPKVVTEFRQHLEEGFDLVIASRMLKGGANEEDRSILKPRKWFVLGLGLAAALCWKTEGNQVQDVLHGLRAMRKDSFFAIDPIGEGLSIDLEMVSRSYKKGMKRIEFPVKEVSRLSGISHFPAFATGKKLLRYFARELFRR